jgi:hypothetical protein
VRVERYTHLTDNSNTCIFHNRSLSNTQHKAPTLPPCKGLAGHQPRSPLTPTAPTNHPHRERALGTLLAVKGKVIQEKVRDRVEKCTLARCSVITQCHPTPPSFSRAASRAARKASSVRLNSVHRRQNPHPNLLDDSHTPPRACWQDAHQQPALLTGGASRLYAGETTWNNICCEFWLSTRCKPLGPPYFKTTIQMHPCS